MKGVRRRPSPATWDHRLAIIQATTVTDRRLPSCDWKWRHAHNTSTSYVRVPLLNVVTSDPTQSQVSTVHWTQSLFATCLSVSWRSPVAPILFFGRKTKLNYQIILTKKKKFWFFSYIIWLNNLNKTLKIMRLAFFFPLYAPIYSLVNFTYKIGEWEKSSQKVFSHIFQLRMTTGKYRLNFNSYSWMMDWFKFV